MADDIVTRLREEESRDIWGLDVWSLMQDAADEIERLRRLGDTLAHHVRAGESKEMYSVVHAWEEARRG